MKQKVNIEAQLRKKSMRMKTVNNHQDVVLKGRLANLDREAVCSLEDHFKQTKEIAELLRSCSSSTGACKCSEKPEKGDSHGCLVDLRTMTNPWSYFAHCDIEYWEKQAEVHPIRSPRPKTSGERGKQHTTTPPGEKPSLQTRPHTVAHMASSSSSRSVEGRTTPTTARNRTARKIDISVPMRRRPQSCEFMSSKPRSMSRGLATKTPTILEAEDEDYAAVQTEGEALAETIRPLHSDGPAAPNRGGLYVTLPALKDCKSNGNSDGRVSRESTTTERSPPTAVATTPNAADPAVFGERGSVVGLADSPRRQRRRQLTMSAPRRPTRPVSTLIDPSFYDEDPARVFTPKPIKPARQNFYIPPQERYKAEDMFLMRRFLLLQKQMNSDSVGGGCVANPDKMKIHVAFSSSARKKSLLKLVEENTTHIKHEKKKFEDSSIQEKVDRFLESLSAFINEESTQSLATSNY